MRRNTNHGVQTSSTLSTSAIRVFSFFLALVVGAPFWVRSPGAWRSWPELILRDLYQPDTGTGKEGSPMSKISKTRHVTTHRLALVFPAHCGHDSSEWFQWRAAKTRPWLLCSRSQKLGHRAAAPCRCLAPKAKVFHSVRQS